MARECPAVVQGPFDLTLVRGKPLEKHLDIQVIAVQVVKMDHIGLNCSKSSKKTFRCSPTMKASLTIYASLKYIEFNLCIRGKLHFVRIICLTISTPERI